MTTGTQKAALPDYLAPGAIVGGKYRVEELVATGGMGVVLRATHVELGGDVALKVLAASVVDAGSVDRFLREARVVARIRSEHVVRVLDVGALPTGAPFIVMEFLVGEDLQRFARARGRFTPVEAVGLVLQATRGVAEAHRLGIVHRDIKPSNLFVASRADGSPLVKVLDFGIAKQLHASEEALTAAGDVLGSPVYMAPEQIRDPRSVDARVDLWALGSVLYRLLTGWAPYAAETSSGALARIVSDPAPLLRRDRPDASPELEAVVLRCLEKDPDRRYARAEELVAALEGLMSAGTSSASAAGAASARGAKVASTATPLAPSGGGTPGARAPGGDVAAGFGGATEDTTELRDLVLAALGKAGISGSIAVVRDMIELRQPGRTPIAISIGPILAQWYLLPPDSRTRRVEEIARRLREAHRAEGGGSASVGLATLDPVARRRALSAVAAVFGVLVLAGAARMLVPRLLEEPVAAPDAGAEPEPERDARLTRACTAVRERIRSNENFGPFALEGFVVDLWLATKGGPDLRTHPAVTSLFARDRLAPTADERLAAVHGGWVHLEDGLDAATAARWPAYHTVRVVFGDGFGRAFFEEEGRARFVGLADRVARATSATYGSLTARCAHDTAHAVGAWFRGPNLAGAAAAMVYEMGMFSDEALVDSDAIVRLRAGGPEIDGLATAAGRIDSLLAEIVGASGGVTLEGPPATIQFGLAAASRSVAATRQLSGRMGLRSASE